ncbi:hypothetical protein DL96DRAFT_1595700 [Flagelloscypha sp. PMI_526]|nr:hypothetical protein DL96DRAFT_1595700 [Flagelloscypha sp. PMI_526]
MVPPDRIGFIASSGGSAVVMVDVQDLQIQELAKSPETTIALMDLLSEKGRITLLLNPNAKRREHLGQCDVRFSRTHVAVFCRFLYGAWNCREVLIYPLQNPLQNSTQDMIWPTARSLLPKGTNNFVFSHITTTDLTFTIFLTYSNSRPEPPQFHKPPPGQPELIHVESEDAYFSPTHTAFTFTFDPSVAKASFVEESSIPDQHMHQDHYSLPQLSRSGRTLVHWGISGEIKCEHIGLGSERKSSVLLKGSRFLNRGGFRGNIVLDLDDRKGLAAWWWTERPRSTITMVKYGHCEGL